MKIEQIRQELNLNLDNQLEGTVEQKITLVIDFLYGGGFDDVWYTLTGQEVSPQLN